MIELFADAGYWIGLLLRKDELHPVATRWAKSLSSSHRLVTTELVLVELLDHTSKHAANIRTQASEMWSDIRSDPSIEIIPASDVLLRQANGLYHQASDKDWCLTDCASFVVMRQRRIEAALTFDHHFIQAGFQALLRVE